VLIPALASRTFAADSTVPCPGDPGHVGRSRGAGPALAGSHAAAEEAERSHAAGLVSEPIHAAVAADAGNSPDASSTDATRSAED